MQEFSLEFLFRIIGEKEVLLAQAMLDNQRLTNEILALRSQLAGKGLEDGGLVKTPNV